MRFTRDLLIPLATGSWLALAGCRGHTTPSCYSDTRFSVTLPGAGELDAATVSTSGSCQAFVSSATIDVFRSAPGSCQVQVALTNGAVYTFSVTFESIAANGICPAHVAPTDASTPVLLERGRCYAAQDAAAGTTGADAGADGGAACATLKTAHGVEPMLTCGCAPTDPQACSTPCGPEERGTMPVTCTAGVYTRGATACAFDAAGDYSCYQFPTAQPNPACPADASGIATPQDATACTVEHCVVCNSYGGIPGGVYLDARGATHVGYCVCRPPDSAGRRTWSCADYADWPCSSGC